LLIKARKEKNDMKNNVVTYVTSFAIGAAAGTAIALLNAPQSGQKTRAKLRKSVSDARTQTKKTVTRVQTRTMNTIEDIKHRLEVIRDEIVLQVESLKKASRRIAEKL
jgi:gas vesicle protein